MANIIIPSYWKDTKPPVGSQINWGHPLSQGLVGCWLMNESSGNQIRDLVMNMVGNFTNTIWKNTSKDTAINCGTAGYITVLRNTIFEPKSELTVVQVCRTSVSSGNVDPICKRANNSGNASYVIDFDAASSYKIRWFGYDTGWQIASSDATGYNNGRFHTIIGIHKGTVLSLNINGKPQSSTDNLTLTYTTPNELLIGGYRSGAGTYSGYFNGDILLTYIYRRALFQAECFALHEAPYQFIQPIKRRFFSYPAIMAEAGTQAPVVQSAHQFIMVA